MRQGLAIITTAALTALSLAGCCPAGMAPPAAAPKPMDGPIVTVSAMGEVKAVPDQAQFSIEVSATAPTADAATQAVNTDGAALIERLKAEGVPAKDIQTSFVQLRPRYSQSRPVPVPRRTDEPSNYEPPKIIDYEASYALNVTFDDTENASQLMGGIANASGVTNIHGPNLGFSDTTELEGKALADAVAKARRKAEILATEAGMEILEPLRVDSGGSNVPMPRGNMMMMAKAEAAPMPIAAGEESFTASVTVTFRARPKH